MTTLNPIDAWSYSRYALYTLCPLKFKLQNIDKVKTPQSPAMQRGDTIHKGIAAYLKDSSASVPAEALQHKVFETMLLEMKSWPDKNVEQQWGYTFDMKPTGWFSKGTNHTWFRNILDVGLMYEDMTYEAVDWKTGKKYDSNEEQMETQALAIMCQFVPVTHVHTRMAYLDSGQEEQADYPATHKQKLIDKWKKKVAPMFSDTVFAPRPNDKCKFCDYARSKMGLCPFG